MAMQNNNFITIVPSNEVYVVEDTVMVFKTETNPNNCILLTPEVSLHQINTNRKIDDIPSTSQRQNPYAITTEDLKRNIDTKIVNPICNCIETDAPEYVDVNDLTGTRANFDDAEATIPVSDDDDVIFVAEYKNGENTLNSYMEEEPVDQEAPRRNPVRKVRNNRALADILFEEDFAFLDQIDEPEASCRVNFNKKASVGASTVNNFKEWPINVHERPEYNTVTKKIENFDYTIRQIQKVVPKKQLEKIKPVKKKKKYLTRNKKPKVFVEEKVPIKELAPLVNSTMDLLLEFISSRKDWKNISNENQDENSKVKLQERSLQMLLETQAILCSITNGSFDSEDTK